MKKTILFLLLCSSALAQVINAPRIPNVTIQRLRTDAVTFSVRFQQEGVNLDVSGVDYKCDIIEANRSVVSLTVGAGITRPDSATLKITLTSGQVRALARENYQ